MAVALEQYWLMRGRYTEGREALAQGLGPAAGDPALRSRALAEMARLCAHIGDAEGVSTYAQQAVAVGRRTSPCVGLSRGLGMAGIHSMWLGERTHAHALFEESIDVAVEAGESRFGWMGRMGLVLLAFDRGDISHGRRLGDELLAA